MSPQPDTPDPADLVTQMMNAMMQMAECLTGLVDMLKGYKANLEAAGFSSVSADRMCEDLHNRLTYLMFIGNNK